MSAPRPLYVHLLAGCAPRPLASYLKALGVLRVVAEQADHSARGCWRQDRFVLHTTLDREALARFFLWEWRPSPFVSPWNKGSGLLGEDPKGVGPLVGSTAPRFAEVRAGIAAARALTAEMEEAVQEEKRIKDEKSQIKDKAGKERLAADPAYKARLAAAARRARQLKDRIQPECQRRWRGPELRWLRAAVVLDAEGGATFPALLGTGGNDGRLDFTNNAMQRLSTLFELGSPDGRPRPGAAEALDAALSGEAAPALVAGAIGQFSPATSGGPNATTGPLAESALNPWDLPLLLEGALLFTAGTSRRLGGASSERTVAPFTARALSSGYGSAALADEGDRGEQWMPLWSRPWTAGEVAALLAEGRCQVGARGSESALDVARAIARLGVARGVDSFQRYGYFERNGRSNYAVPLGRWEVRAEPLVRLLDDLEAGEWWERLRRAARDERAPGSVSRLARRLEDAAMAALSSGAPPLAWRRVLIALAELEARLVESGAFTVGKRLGPIPRLSPGWVRAVDDGGPTVRLALSLAGAGQGHDAQQRPLDPVRHHWLPLDRIGRFAVRERGLADDPRVVMTGRDPEGDLVRLVQRRVTEAEAGASRRLPIVARPGTGAGLVDLMALARGEVDLGEVLALARGLSALDWSRYRPDTHGPARPLDEAPVDPGWAALRLCHLPGSVRAGLSIPVDPAISRALAAGDAPRAFALTRARLRAAGLRTPTRALALDPIAARRWAASLAFPLSARVAESLVAALDFDASIYKQESHHVR